MPYRHDYHTHSRRSPDGADDLVTMCRAAQAAGLTELAVTDHYDLGGMQWVTPPPLPQADFEQARKQTGMALLRGVELGQAHHEPAAADRLLAEHAPEFVIGSIHNLRGQGDFYFLSYRNADDAYRLLDAYIEELFELVNWGKFHVLGHLTYPLRYIPQQLRVSFDRYHERLQVLFRQLSTKGLGLEVNVSGLSRPEATTYPDLSLLELYRQCGGEIITIGSDAHRASDVGRCNEQAIQLLLQAGFSHLSRFTDGQLTFERIIP